ncbi:MAG: exopolysaccharide biosynthesis protein exod [Alphaproteobacteria bacterium CG11_big_fil_rev_8_21_14_0_20_39_49]|nr:MAG: exopolysaccharide biosynthesis protein exod [Alphaproteobacteria bacterium CG11_big_fil_rev_8_21_14_0_20_39_49]
MSKKDRLASDVLEGVVRDNRNDRISLHEIKTALHERGFGILMVFFALPLCVPALPPGLTAVPAIPLIVFSIQMIRGMDSPWMPKKIGAKTIKRETVALIVEKAAPYLRKAERVLRPRFSFASSPEGEKVIGFFALFFAISILIPLPFTNLIPAVGILFMSLGLLSKDGIFIILGMVTGTIGITITTLIIFFGKKFVMEIFNAVSPVAS